MFYTGKRRTAVDPGGVLTIGRVYWASEAAILAFLHNLNRTQSVTILIVTHLLPIVLNLATSIMLLGTRTILRGPVDEVLPEDRLSELYQVPVHLGIVAGQRTLVVGRPNDVDV